MRYGGGLNLDLKCEQKGRRTQFGEGERSKEVEIERVASEGSGGGR